MRKLALLLVVSLLGIAAVSCGGSDSDSKAPTQAPTNTPGPATPTVDPGTLGITGTVVYGGDKDRSYGLYIWSQDGPKHISEDDTPNTSPALSFDGKKIAWVKSVAGGSVIYVMNVDGSDAMQITEIGQGSATARMDLFPAWSPDGRHIAFTSLRDNNTDIYVVDIETKEEVRLTQEPDVDGSPAYSPDGKQIVFSSKRLGNLQIYVMNADGSNVTRLTNNSATEGAPAWSPDGKQIAFTSNRDGNPEIYVMNADGSNQHNVSNSAASDELPAWSPDSKRVIYSSSPGPSGAPYSLWIADAAGGNAVRLTADETSDRDPDWR